MQLMGYKPLNSCVDKKSGYCIMEKVFTSRSELKFKFFDYLNENLMYGSASEIF